jgi:ComF family protein
MNPIDRFLSLLAPQVCIGCNGEGAVLCQECQDSITPSPSICFACGKATRNFRPCPDCISRNKPGHTWIFTEYANKPKDLIRALKFDQRRQGAKEIALLMDESFPYFASEPVVTFVPTSSGRRRERGFDQAELIAKELAKIRGWHYQRCLTRQKNTRQLGANRQERLKQLKGVFRPSGQTLTGRSILLVDDVCTTGATLEACTKELKKAGVAQIDAVVFARTPKK